MDRRGVTKWVDGYERAWRANDGAAIEALFTPDARYRRSPYEDSIVGHAALAAFWVEDDEDGEVFTMDFDVVAVGGADAVVRAEVRYGEPLRQEYRDLWVLHFADDRRVDDFEEWPYWPGRPFIAEGD
jgi:SnoaL-like domain